MVRSSTVGKRSAGSNSTPTVDRYFYNDRLTVFCHRFRSGETLEHSTGDPGVDAWISSLRASRANHSVRPAEEEKPKRVFSTRSNVWSKKFSLWPLYSRMSWRAPSPNIFARTCTASAPPSWVPRITESDSGWLPTPTTRNNQQSVSMLKWPAYLRLDILCRGKKLPIEFWEWMMGWPIGWTDLKPLEMAKFRSWLEKHGKIMSGGNNDGQKHVPT